MKRKIFLVDAFSDKPFGGNPAGVVIEAQGLKENHMQLIAREMNLSETAFVIKSDVSGYDYQVRFFTPTQEVDLCGHATIATFFVINDQLRLESLDDKTIIRQKTKAGILPIELNFIKGELQSVMMTQTTPIFYKEELDLSKLADILGLGIDDIGIDGFNICPEIVSTGLKDIILPVRSLLELRKIRPDMNRLSSYSNDLGVTGVHAFTLEAEEASSDLSCRNFAPAVGINEESATGTSNGALGAYLIKNSIFNLIDTRRFVCEQGYYMDRPSKIVVEINGTKDNMDIKVGGKAVIVLEGSIEVGE